MQIFHWGGLSVLLEYLVFNIQYLISAGSSSGHLRPGGVREGPGLSDLGPPAAVLLLPLLLQTVEEKLPASTWRLCWLQRSHLFILWKQK